MELDSKVLSARVAEILNNKGALDIEILEVGHLTSIADYFVICSGRNAMAVRSLAEDLEDKLAEIDVMPRRTEGARESKWIVLDYATVIVHIFHPEERQYYNIERLWQDGTNQVEFISIEDRK
ncbi:MAG: ribosome silencing factor [Clostridia bacterium]|nr:ribosome silencing factor [Clostridia bacterium]